MTVGFHRSDRTQKRMPSPAPPYAITELIFVNICKLSFRVFSGIVHPESVGMNDCYRSAQAPVSNMVSSWSSVIPIDSARRMTSSSLSKQMMLLSDRSLMSLLMME